MSLIFSRRLAIAIGVALLLGETLRLWGGGPIAWGQDHYLMSAVLLYGAWRSHRYGISDSYYLLAAWAFTCGIEYMNLVKQLERIHSPSPASIPPVWVGIIGFGYLLCLLGLAASLKAQQGAGGDRTR